MLSYHHITTLSHDRIIIALHYHIIILLYYRITLPGARAEPWPGRGRGPGRGRAWAGSGQFCCFHVLTCLYVIVYRFSVPQSYAYYYALPGGESKGRVSEAGHTARTARTV